MADCLADDNLGSEVIAFNIEEGINIDDAIFSSQPLIALQPLSEQNSDDIKIEITEEVLDESFDVPHIAEEQEITSVSVSPKQHSKKRKQKSSKPNRNKKTKTNNTNGEDEGSTDIDVPRKWERKKSPN